MKELNVLEKKEKVSIRLAVNKIELEGTTYNIDKASSSPEIKEQRLILEISYRYKDNEIVEEHDVVNDINVGNSYSITLDKSYVHKNHIMKLIPGGNNTVIKSYFFKAWANYIYFLDEPSLPDTTESIEPLRVLKNQNMDKNLILA
jgi:hypothetical protein